VPLDISNFFKIDLNIGFFNILVLKSLINWKFLKNESNTNTLDFFSGVIAPIISFLIVFVTRNWADKKIFVNFQNPYSKRKVLNIKHFSTCTGWKIPKSRACNTSFGVCYVISSMLPHFHIIFWSVMASSYWNI